MATYNSTMHIVLWLKGILPTLCNEVGQIPSFKILASLKPCGVSTIRKAIHQLEKEGIVVSKHGYGTFLLQDNYKTVTSPHKVSKQNNLISTFNSSNDQPKEKPLIALLIPLYLNKKKVQKMIAQYMSFISAGVSQAADEFECEISVHFYEQHKDVSAKSIHGFIRYIKNNKCSAVLLTSISEVDVIKNIAATGIPGVLIDHWAPPSVNWLSILPNDFHAFREMVLILFQLQHKRMALIVDMDNNTLNPDILEGYQSGLKKIGINYDEKLILSVGIDHQEFKFFIRKLMRLLKSKNKPSALIIHTNFAVPGIVHALKSKGYSIPKDISVFIMGPEMDKVKYLNASGFKVDWHKMGRIAVARALDLINKRILTSTTEYIDMEYSPGETISFKPNNIV
ncbi:MAG: hypothetical protein COA79_17285 [Planctomycetota bacterium]|nr:MAG: hypothetical protein COA79_17285 [Planctomycetota bacterium]